MKWSLIKRKLARVDRALDKAIDAAETPGAVVYARMLRDGEVLEHVSERGFAVVRPERIPMHRETIFDVASCRPGAYGCEFGERARSGRGQQQ